MILQKKYRDYSKDKEKKNKKKKNVCTGNLKNPPHQRLSSDIYVRVVSQRKIYNSHTEFLFAFRSLHQKGLRFGGLGYFYLFCSCCCCYFLPPLCFLSVIIQHLSTLILLNREYQTWQQQKVSLIIELHHLHKYVYIMTGTDIAILIKTVMWDLTKYFVQSHKTPQRKVPKGPLNQLC